MIQMVLGFIVVCIGRWKEKVEQEEEGNAITRGKMCKRMRRKCD